METTYSIEISAVNGRPYHTVNAADEFGTFDLNAEGEPCETAGELAEFIRELCEQGAYDINTRNELLAELD